MSMKIIYKILNNIYAKIIGTPERQTLINAAPNEASEEIAKLLASGRPCMVARFGAFELTTIVNYLGVSNPKHSIVKFIKGEQPQWWWNESTLRYMESNAGFYPSNHETISKFSELMLNDAKELDVLGSWLSSERYVEHYYPSATKVKLLSLEPYLSDHPWTKILEGRRVLVVHPFAELIEKQYKENRTKLFDNPDVLPEFHLDSIKAVQSMGGVNNDFKNWFDALEWMKREIDKREYDVCLIGCGAYGFPLAAHCKRMGKQAIHLGGALQLLFGIKGKRWEDENYGVSFGVPQGYYVKLLSNEYWVRPGEDNKPANSKEVENECYW